MPIVSRLRNQQGFTIVELSIIVAIIGALAGLAVPTYVGYLDKARIARCIAEIRYIERAVDAYEAANDTLPDTLAEAGAGNMVDPWGNPYEYLNIAALAPPGAGGGGGGAGGGAPAPAPAPGAPGGGGGGGAAPAPAAPGGGGGGGAAPAPAAPAGGAGGHGAWHWMLPDEAYAAGNATGSGTGNADRGKPRKDRFLHPINSDYDLYSMGKDGESVEPLTAKKSHDDVIRANDGQFVGLATEF